MSKSELPGEHKCDRCGLDFFRKPETIYKFSYKGRTKDFCSWTCYESCLKLKKARNYAELDPILIDHIYWNKEKNYEDI